MAVQRASRAIQLVLRTGFWHYQVENVEGFDKSLKARDRMAVQTSSATTSIADKSRRRWHFGRCILDERTHELLVDSVDAEIERKPLEVLIYLLQHAGEVCTKDELLAGVWPGRILSETVLTKCIGRLREVLHDDDQDIIKTAYGFGYRFVASVRVESVAVPEPVRFDLGPGVHPPSRPLWTLVERLGSGGHGEAWRARHEKTNEQRVFKFALEEAALIALKREITLFRVINDTLGENARVVKLLDWNLEQIPYFVEAEFVTGGSLVDWAALRGGLAAMPISDRLEIVAQIAEALGAVHSVGVLHKDLKPSNVLVRPRPGGAVEIVLADFGSGGLFDLARLESLGITRLGFTKTIASLDGQSGTPMYLAPEILSGQAFTVKSDIYALGMILYQFLVGDVHRVMSPGWERGIDDELLREDISVMAEGNPAERLGDAHMIARRLRTLDVRRRTLAAEREADAKAERDRRILERARARRFGLALAFGALVVGLAVSTSLFIRARHAQERTAAAAATSNAVTEFLSKDVFSPISSGTESVKDMTVIELLARAGNVVDRRFALQPEIASQLHYVIGRSLNEFYETPLAVPHFKRALELGVALNGVGSESAMLSAAELVELDYVLGNLVNTIRRYEDTLLAGAATLSPTNPALLTLRQKLALGHYKLGFWTKAANEFKTLITDSTDDVVGNPAFIGRTNFYLGQALVSLARPMEAQRHLRIAITQLTAALGSNHSDVAEARAALGRALGDAGQYDEAEIQLNLAESIATAWARPGTWTVFRPKYFKGLLRLEMDQPDQAQSMLSEIVQYQDAHALGKRPELDHTGTVRQALAEAYLRRGETTNSIRLLQSAAPISALADGPMHPHTRSIRVSLAESLIADGRLSEAQTVLITPAMIDFQDLPSMHPFAGQLLRVKGLLARQSGDLAGARSFFRGSLDIYQSLYGPKYWRSVQAKTDLSIVSH